MGLSLEKQMLEQTVKELTEKGLPLVKRDVKIGRSRPDLVAYTLNNEGNEVVQVVAEVTSKSDTTAQQQLMKYVQGINAPYALLVLPDKKYWFDGKSFLPVEEPKFRSDKSYFVKYEMIEKSALEALEITRGVLPSEQQGKFMAHSLLIRAYLNEQDQMNQWEEIDNFEHFKRLLHEALRFYEINSSQINYEVPSEQLGGYLNKLTLLPPIHTALRRLIMKCLEVNKPVMGQYNAPGHLRELFVGLTKQLEFEKDNVVDLASGYGSIAFDVIEANNIEKLNGFEIYHETCAISKIMAIVSGIGSFKANCEDTIKENTLLKDDTYSLSLLDPPLGLKYKLPEDLRSKYKLAQKRFDGTDLFIEKAINVTKPGGYIVMLTQESVLFSEKYKNTREFIKDQTIIESIVSLPTHTLKPYSSVKLSVLVLRKKKERNESADNIFLAKAETVDDFQEVINGFAKWKKGELPNG